MEHLDVSLPRLACVGPLLALCHSWSVPVDFIEHGDEMPRGAGWRYLDSCGVGTIFAVQFGLLADNKTFVPGRIAAYRPGLWALNHRRARKLFGGFCLEAVLLHELAHAVVGGSESLCTVWEREVGRRILSPYKYRNLRAYSGSTEESLALTEDKFDLDPGWTRHLRPVSPALPEDTGA